jgi:hypothetical protein
MKIKFSKEKPVSEAPNPLLVMLTINVLRYIYKEFTDMQSDGNSVFMKMCGKRERTQTMLQVASLLKKTISQLSAEEQFSIENIDHNEQARKRIKSFVSNHNLVPDTSDLKDLDTKEPYFTWYMLDLTYAVYLLGQYILQNHTKEDNLIDRTLPDTYDEVLIHYKDSANPHVRCLGELEAALRPIVNQIIQDETAPPA